CARSRPWYFDVW
nr:immunoglobulin heavy chain junction region [Mus musculus]NSM04574.1 immunoglobulin heavy chain junction region [Mus musculus]